MKRGLTEAEKAEKLKLQKQILTEIANVIRIAGEELSDDNVEIYLRCVKSAKIALDQLIRILEVCKHSETRQK